MIPTNDLVHEYERRNIHPGNKLEVGRRLAYLGLNRDYGFRMDSDIEGLEVAGSDMQFHPVRTFRLDNVNGLMYIHHDSVPEPKYVRYCWGDWILGNLISCDGFPMQTFCIGVDSM